VPILSELCVPWHTYTELDKLNLEGNIMFKAFARLAFIALISINTASACQLVDKRVCEIDTKLKAATGGHAVQYVADFSARLAEYEWALGQPDVIHLGDTQLLDDDQLLFVLAHEYAHSMLKHGRKYVESFAPDSALALSDEALMQQYGEAARTQAAPEALSHQQEYDADAFAAKLLNKDGIDFAKVMRGFLQSTGGSSTHPSKRARIEQAKKAVELAHAD
jgi:hypothetical protein